jgi:GGDEF domain-containing protein
MYRERINTLINNQMNSTEDEELRKYLSSLIPKESFIAHIGGDDFFVGLKDFNHDAIFPML